MEKLMEKLKVIVGSILILLLWPFVMVYGLMVEISKVFFQILTGRAYKGEKNRYKELRY